MSNPIYTDNKKYKTINNDGLLTVYRHGEEWSDFTGNKYVLSLVHEIESLKEHLKFIKLSQIPKFQVIEFGNMFTPKIVDIHLCTGGVEVKDENGKFTEFTFEKFEDYFFNTLALLHGDDEAYYKALAVMFNFIDRDELDELNETDIKSIDPRIKYCSIDSLYVKIWFNWQWKNIPEKNLKPDGMHQDGRKEFQGRQNKIMRDIKKFLDDPENEFEVI